MPASAPAPEERQQLLSFYLAGEEYGVEILRIREVVEYQRLTPVPTTPAWVRGVMNLRGTVVPVIDLASKFQQEPTRVEKLTCIVIFEVDLEDEPTPVGVMIDRVGRVLELTEDEIQEPPSFGSPVRPELLEGIGMVDETPITILDIQKVLTEDELAVAVAGTEAAETAETADAEPTAKAKKRTKPPASAKARTKKRTTKPTDKRTKGQSVSEGKSRADAGAKADPKAEREPRPARTPNGTTSRRTKRKGGTARGQSSGNKPTASEPPASRSKPSKDPAGD